jgi:uncharacterized protein
MSNTQVILCPTSWDVIARIPSLDCYRCGYVWRPRQPVVHMCPRCKSRLWDVPKVQSSRPGRGPGVEEILGPHRAEIRRLARKYHARGLLAFGSVARREATARSDVDLLLDRAPGWEPFDRFRLQDALERLLQRRVDLTTEAGLHPLIRAQALHEAVPV